MALIDDQPGDPPPMSDPDQPSAGIVRILEHVQANADFYRVLLGKKGDPAFCARSFRQFIEQQFRHLLPSEQVESDSRSPQTDLSVSYIVHAGIGAILWWLENDQPCPPEQMAAWLNQFGQADMRVSLGLKRNAADRG
jgi:hypothetical protein